VQRRKFIRVSGFSAASLLFMSIDAQTGKAVHPMRYPDTVSVRCEGNWIPLKGKPEHWFEEDIEVSFLQSGDSLGVYVQAPQRALEFVRCTWKQNFGDTQKCLNDHWERSYGDLSWESTDLKRRSPWYTLISDGLKTQAFGVKTQANSIGSWQLNPSGLELLLDTHSGGQGVLLGDRRLHAADILATENLPGENPFHTDIRFCKMMCPDPKLPAQPVYGINDWYFAYGNNSRELILETTGMMADLAPNHTNKPFSVIDMGWSVKPLKSPDEFCWGDDFTRSNDKFGDMSVVASAIKNLGMRPGLWTRPLLANGKDNPSALIPVRDDQTDKKERYLDPTIPENLDRIGSTIRLYKTWGYQLVKHDYTSYDLFGRWGFQMNENMTAGGWHFNNRSKTNAEILLELYRTIRGGAAGDMLLIGCNTFSHLSAGIFELNRIGDDTSGNEWDRTLKMGVNTLGFRLPQHNTFYAADGDCVGLTTKIPWQKNRQWLQLLAESSAPLFISAQPEALGAVQKEAIKQSFTRASRVQPLGEPLDWMKNPRPADWKLNGRIIHFDWT
jgi:alpha-galactosidase